MRWNITPGGSDSKESAGNTGNLGLIPTLGRSPGKGNSYPLQYSCLENPTDRGAWQATVHGIATLSLFFHMTCVKSHEGQQAIFAQIISPHAGLILSINSSLNNAYWTNLRQFHIKSIQCIFLESSLLHEIFCGSSKTRRTCALQPNENRKKNGAPQSLCTCPAFSIITTPLLHFSKWLGQFLKFSQHSINIHQMSHILHDVKVGAGMMASEKNSYKIQCMLVCVLRHVCLFATLWTAAHQAPLSLVFSREEYQSGLPFPSPGDLSKPGIKPGSPTLQADSLPTETQIVV